MGRDIRAPPDRYPQPPRSGITSPRTAVGRCGRGAAGWTRPGGAVFPVGRRGTTIATMKKLLLLVVIAALATIATKKVRSA
jgi:hypothetical protein